MIKIYQTVVDKNKGNCMQAAMASLFEDSLENVPNFIEFGDRWFDEMRNYIKNKGYTYKGFIYNPNVVGKNILKEFSLCTIKDYQGVDGYFYAVVYSPLFYDEKDFSPATHTVIIDKDFNIIHDVNKIYNKGTKYPLTDEIGYNGIVKIKLFEPIKE